MSYWSRQRIMQPWDPFNGAPWPCVHVLLTMSVPRSTRRTRVRSALKAAELHVVATLKRPVRRAVEASASRVATALEADLRQISAGIVRIERGLPSTGTKPYLFDTIHDLLHAQRSVELSQMPKGATTLLSAGCSGAWCFEWLEREYGPVQRHIGVERYLPRPNDLPPNVDWIAASVAQMPDIESGSVDLLFSGQNIEHLFGDDVVGFLLESARVIRPGGHVVINSPNREMARLLAWSMNQHTIELTPSEAAELTHLAGFDVTALRGVWLVRNPRTGAIMPLDPYLPEASPHGPIDVLSRIQLAARYPEHSFIWWLEAQRSQRIPDRAALHRRYAEIFESAWPEAYQ